MFLPVCFGLGEERRNVAPRGDERIFPCRRAGFADDHLSTRRYSPSISLTSAGTISPRRIWTMSPGTSSLPGSVTQTPSRDVRASGGRGVREHGCGVEWNWKGQREDRRTGRAYGERGEDGEQGRGIDLPVSGDGWIRVRKVVFGCLARGRFSARCMEDISGRRPGGRRRVDSGPYRGRKGDGE